VQSLQASITRGQSAQWAVSAWTQNGNVPHAVVSLAASPASITPNFSFGCGSYDGTSSCDLGAMAANSSPREVVAKATVAATASAVTSVRLTVTASAAYLPVDPAASVTVAVTAASAGAGTSSAGAGTGGTTTSPLSVGNLPFLSSSSNNNINRLLSPGGNAAGLFPALTPSGSASGNGGNGQRANARTVANAAALPLGGSVVGGQVIGLGALALAFVLAVTRLSLRRRPALAPASAAAEPPLPADPAADENTPEE
jgi:hypothetical protein